MLVLSRKQNQQILIGNDIKITVLKIRGKTVRLGIEAPRHVQVARGEIVPKEVDVTVEFVNHDTGDGSSKNGLRVISIDSAQTNRESPDTVVSLDGFSGNKADTPNADTNRLQEIVAQITKN